MNNIITVAQRFVPSSRSAVYIGAGVGILIIVLSIAVYLYWVITRQKTGTSEEDTQPNPRNSGNLSAPGLASGPAPGTDSGIASGPATGLAPGPALDLATVPVSEFDLNSLYGSDVFMSVARRNVDGSLTKVGEFVMQLEWNAAPDTCFKFARFCADKSYKDSNFDQVIKDVMIQCGHSDFDMYETANDGSQVFSKVVTPFENISATDDLNKPLHNAGTVAIANANTPGDCRFFIVTTDEGARNLQHGGVFARISSGMDTVLNIAQVATDSNHAPTENIIIANCGLVKNQDNQVPN